MSEFLAKSEEGTLVESKQETPVESEQETLVESRPETCLVCGVDCGKIGVHEFEKPF